MKKDAYFQKVVTDFAHVAMKHHISDANWRCWVSADVAKDNLGGVILTMAAKMVAINDLVEETQGVQWPADWWQAFRLRWFPAWWLDKYPIEFTKQTFVTKLTRVCPHLSFPEGSKIHLDWLVDGREPYECPFCERRRRHEYSQSLSFFNKPANPEDLEKKL